MFCEISSLFLNVIAVLKDLVYLYSYPYRLNLVRFNGSLNECYMLAYVCENFPVVSFHRRIWSSENKFKEDIYRPRMMSVYRIDLYRYLRLFIPIPESKDPQTGSVRTEEIPSGVSRKNGNQKSNERHMYG